MNIAVIIPAYNEATTIANVVQRVLTVCKRVIVVDDGSTDGTAECLHQFNIEVLRNPDNCGKAASLWRGVERALETGAEAVITLDADGQHRPEDIPKLITAAKAQPRRIIIGARLQHRERTPPLRLFGNRCANFWISWAAGHAISDSQSGFRLYPAEVFAFCQKPALSNQSFVFESRVLIEAAHRGYLTLPVEIEAIYNAGRRPSYYRPALDTLRIIRMVAWQLLMRGMYPLGLIRSLGLLSSQRLE